MNKANQNQKNIEPRQVVLYCNVFYSRVSSTVVLLLCLSFLLQPIERVFAYENETVSTSNTVINLAVDAGLSNSPNDSQADATIAEIPNETTGDDTVRTEPSGDDVATSSDETQDTDSERGTDDTVGSDETGTTTEFTDEEIEDLINPEDELPEADVIESATTSTITVENPIAISTVHSDAVMQFNRNDCVTVEDGSFYCQSKKEESEQGTDGMYALQDKDGDLEIFLQKNGELAQLTFNTVDDAAPSFDAKSNSIVWHRLVDERYQIISFNLDTREEAQLTADNVNNMEPSRSGDYTVWQRWNDTNWDIVLYDGTETKFLTNDSQHDIAPNVKGDLVMWNRLASDNTQTIELFDIATQEFTTITDEEGGALSNPRMVLVYETAFANGDVVTKGYDVETKEVTPLANDPAKLPEELPEPDATGETRALLQPKNPTKEDSEFSEDLFPGIEGTNGSLASTTSTTSPATTQSFDLHIASSSPAIAGSTATVTNATTSLQELTLDLTPPILPDSEVTYDLVVPSFTPDQQNSIIETNE